MVWVIKVSGNFPAAKTEDLDITDLYRVKMHFVKHIQPRVQTTSRLARVSGEITYADLLLTQAVSDFLLYFSGETSPGKHFSIFYTGRQEIGFPAIVRCFVYARSSTRLENEKVTDVQI